MLRRPQQKITPEEFTNYLVHELIEARAHLEKLLVEWETDKISVPASINLKFQNAYEFMLKQSIINETSK